MGNSGKGKTCKGNSKRKPNTNIQEKRPLKGPERETTEQSAQRISNKLDFKVAPNYATTRGFSKYCAAKMRRRRELRHQQNDETPTDNSDWPADHCYVGRHCLVPADRRNGGRSAFRFRRHKNLVGDGRQNSFNNSVTSRILSYNRLPTKKVNK